VKIWDVKTGECLFTLDGHTDHVRGVKFSPDGRKLVSAGLDQSVRIWDVKTGKNVNTLSRNNVLNYQYFGVDVHPEKQLFLIFREDNTFYFWSLETGERMFQFKTGEKPVISLSKDGRFLASGDADGIIKIFNVNNREEIKSIQAHTSGIVSIAISEDGKFIASAEENGALYLRNTETGELLRTLRGHTQPILSLNFSPTSTYLAAGTKGETGGSGDASLIIWNVQTGEVIRSFENLAHSVRNVMFSSDEKQIAAILGVLLATMDISMEDSEVSSGRVMMIEDKHSYYRNYICLTLSPDGKTLAASAETSVVEIWDNLKEEDKKFHPGKLIKTLEHGGKLTMAISYSEDGKHIFTIDENAATRVWEVTTGRLLVTFVPFIDGSWVTYTPEGFFDGSPSGWKHISWRINNQLYPLELYLNEFYQPGLMADILKQKKPVTEILKDRGDERYKLDFAEKRPQASKGCCYYQRFRQKRLCQR
jgi:WD40 repeat protein